MDKPRGVNIDFSFWELLDEVGSWFLQGAAVVGGGPYTPSTPHPITGTIIVTSPGIKIFFPMWGTRINVTGSTSIEVPSGDRVILVPNIKYPVTNQDKAYQISSPGTAVRDEGQFCFFLGGRRGNTIYMRPDTVITV